MRRPVLVVSVLAVLSFCVFAVNRTDTTGAQEGASAPVDDVVGSWRITVTPPQGQPHPGLMTFAADGTLLVADLPAQPAPPGLPVTTLLFSGGHGAWEPTGEDAAFTFDVLVASETGMPIGILRLRGTAELHPEGQRLVATYIVDFADPAGQVLSTGQGALQGTRIRVESPGTPAVATPMTGTPVT